jgi:transcriptional regulator with XRE-family HTH domain
MVNPANTPAYAGFVPGQRKEESPKKQQRIDFPERIAAFRRDRGLTQQGLADMVGMGITQIKRYEAGASQPTLDVIRNLAKALRVTSDELLFGTTERGPDEDLRLQFEAVAKFDAEEKKAVRSVLDGLILRHEARRLSAAETRT